MDSIYKYFDLGYVILKCIERRSLVWGRRYYAAMIVLLVATVVFLAYVAITGQVVLVLGKPVEWLENALPFGAAGVGVDHIFRKLFALALTALCYAVFLSFPGSVFFALFRRTVVDSRPRLKTPKRRVFLRHRALAREKAYFAGIDAVSGVPIYIDDDSRMEHTQIVGVTGGGKTEGGIVPALIHDIAWGRGAVVIDMKGDRSLLEKIAAAVIASGRRDDLLYFSLADPGSSNTYNPLMRGNASEVKDKIISSYIWSEVYYKKASEIATQGICRALQDLQVPVTFGSLLEHMRDVKKIAELKRELDSKGIRHDLESLLSSLDGKTRDLTGLIADLTAIVGSNFGPLVSEAKGEIDLLEAYKQGKIVLFQLNTGLYQETAIRLARIIIQDIKTVSNHIQSYMAPAARHFYPVFIDEFASIAFDAFIELINKARSAKIAVSIAHQSLGDLKNAGEGFQNQIFDNTNTRIVYRQNSAESRDLITKMAGTIEKEKYTHQTDMEMGMAVNTGRGSVRRVETFQVDPNLITEFPTGYCALLQHKKSAGERLRYMKSDYVDISHEASFLRKRIDDAEREEAGKPVIVTLKETETAPELDALKRYLSVCG
jgi:hypothetical protein